MTEDISPDDRIRQWVKSYIAKLTGAAPQDIALDSDLGQFGLDSVDAVMMAGELENELGIEIDPATFLQHPTLESMILSLPRRPA